MRREDETDRRRATKEMRKVEAEMLRKGRPSPAAGGAK